MDYTAVVIAMECARLARRPLGESEVKEGVYV